ncbi:MAG TPA: hypothetical protein VFB34_11575, partial [Chloroflexota bacterium]|nr:hypothetical protein [Chloroflexota bacterium]
ASDEAGRLSRKVVRRFSHGLVAHSGRKLGPSRASSWPGSSKVQRLPGLDSESERLEMAVKAKELDNPLYSRNRC